MCAWALKCSCFFICLSIVILSSFFPYLSSLFVLRFAQIIISYRWAATYRGLKGGACICLIGLSEMEKNRHLVIYILTLIIWQKSVSSLTCMLRAVF